MPTLMIVSTRCSVRVRASRWSSRPGRVLAHVWVSLLGHCPWRFHDASSVSSYQRGRGASVGEWPQTLPTEPWS